MSADKLSRQQVDFVLRRAAEIDSGDGAVAEDPEPEDALSVGEVMRLGEEAGLGPEAIAQALTEMKRGAIAQAEPTDAISRTLGPSHILVSRVVPGPAAGVRRAVERFLREQLMTVRRHHGDRIEWERAGGIWPGLVRSLDFSKRYAFGLAGRVETVVSEASAHATSVTFQIDLSEMRRERLTHMGVRSALAFVVLGLGGAAVMPGFGLYDIVALASGGVAAGSIFALERRRYLESRNRAALAPERFLDLLVQRYLRDQPGGAGAPRLADDESF
ncbi:MAG TPA: hypothetical protein VMU50_06545 [Polyangia bacterium]|nr:hypothetical protein [Polyangia bacterium]